MEAPSFGASGKLVKGPPAVCRAHRSFDNPEVTSSHGPFSLLSEWTLHTLNDLQGAAPEAQIRMVWVGPPTAENGKVGARVRLKVPLRPEKMQGRERITPYIQRLGDPKAGLISTS